MLRRLVREEKGFTLVELLIVMVIIGVLAVVAVPRFIDMRAEAQASACEATRRSMETAIEQYQYYYARYANNNGTQMTDPASITDWPSALSTAFKIARTDGGSTENIQLLKSKPVCPSKGSYSVVDGKVYCSEHAKPPSGSSGGGGSSTEGGS